MTRRRRTVIFGILFGYSSILIGVARNVLFVPIYLQSIPLPEYGAWLATGGALALMLVSDFGLAGVVTQKISAALGGGDLSKLGSLAGSALVIGLVMAISLTAFSFAFVPFLPGLNSLGELQQRAVVQCFVIAVVANAAGLVGATGVSVIRSLQNPIAAGCIVLVGDLANVGVTLIGLFRGAGLYAIAGGLGVRAAVLALAAPLTVAIICSHELGIRIRLRWSSVRELLGDSSRFFLSAIAMRIQAQANVFFVNAILGPTSAATYSLTVRAHETVLMLTGQINTALVPSVTHLFGSGNAARFRTVLMRLLLSLAGFTALALSLTVVLNASFLKLWVGGVAFAGQKVSILMGFALFVSSVGYVAYDALVAQGKFKFVANAFLATSLLQVVLLVAFLHSGLWIAPTATLAAGAVWGLVFWRKVAIGIGATASESLGLLTEIGRITVVSVVTIAGFLRFYPPAATWPALIAEGMLCIGVLAAGYLFISFQIRTIVREELSVTLRALRPVRGT
jgi:O-antigen/teichoic acid export membrane protein